jgi:hypothetical protein
MWDVVCVTDPENDRDTYVKRGELLPDFVDDFTKFALTHTGAVRAVDDAEETPEPATPAEPVRLQEHPPAPVTREPGAVQRPSDSEPKEAWVNYASDERNPERIPRTQAQKMSKDALMDKFRNK